jgi:hypothetical protein
LNQAISWIVPRLAWIVLAIPIALGSAGLITGLDHRPGTSAREELTWGGDQLLTPGLDTIVTGLNPVALDFDALGEQARSAIAALVAADPAALNKSIATGQILVDKITVETTTLRSQLRALPGIGTNSTLQLSPDVIGRWTTVDNVLGSTTGIAQSWAVLSAGSATASQLATLLLAHDTYSGQAVKVGSQGQYSLAVKQLDLSDPTLTKAAGLRDSLANTVDVTTLTQWLNRNAAIDTALRRLYTLLALTGGTVTPDVTAALTQVEAARQQLPPDTRALIVIMSSIAQGGLNQAVIQIEQARGQLAAAIAKLTAVPGGSPNPSLPAPTPSPTPTPVPTGPGSSTAPTQSLPPVVPSGLPQGSPGPSITPPDA